MTLGRAAAFMLAAVLAFPSKAEACFSGHSGEIFNKEIEVEASPDSKAFLVRFPAEIDDLRFRSVEAFLYEVGIPSPILSTMLDVRPEDDKLATVVRFEGSEKYRLEIHVTWSDLICPAYGIRVVGNEDR